jgi:hypothetical protein
VNQLIEASKVTPQPVVDEVREYLMSGEADQYFEVFKKAIKYRQEHIAQARAMSLKVGDRVVIQGVGMGGKYLNGAPATVIGFAIKNVKIRIDAEWDTRRYSHTMRMPPSLLRVAFDAPNRLEDGKVVDTFKDGAWQGEIIDPDEALDEQRGRQVDAG